MKRILFLLLLVPALCGAENGNHYDLPGSFLGCKSVLAAFCYEDFDTDVRFNWLTLQLYEEEANYFYQQELRLYDKGILWSEPLDWQDLSDAERWYAKYGPIFDGIKFPELYYENQVQE